MFLDFQNVRVGWVPDEIMSRLGEQIESGDIPGTYQRKFAVYKDVVDDAAEIEILWHTHDGWGNDRAGITDMVIDRKVNGKYVGF